MAHMYDGEGMDHYESGSCGDNLHENQLSTLNSNVIAWNKGQWPNTKLAMVALTHPDLQYSAISSTYIDRVGVCLDVGWPWDIASM